MSSKIKPGQLRRWTIDGTDFLIISAVADERIEKYGIKHWLIFSNGSTTYKRETSIDEKSHVISEPEVEG